MNRLLNLFKGLLLLALASALLDVSPAYAAEPVKVGVLAFRSKSQTLAQWQPLARVLKQAMPERDFEIEALTLPELQLAASSRQLDFVLTNPAHYVQMKKLIGLSAPLATLAALEGGQRTMVFGGVIFRRADRDDLSVLRDIKGKTIAAVNITLSRVIKCRPTP